MTAPKKLLSLLVAIVFSTFTSFSSTPYYLGITPDGNKIVVITSSDDGAKLKVFSLQNSEVLIEKDWELSPFKPEDVYLDNEHLVVTREENDEKVVLTRLNLNTKEGFSHYAEFKKNDQQGVTVGNRGLIFYTDLDYEDYTKWNIFKINPLENAGGYLESGDQTEFAFQNTELCITQEYKGLAENGIIDPNERTYIVISEIKDRQQLIYLNAGRTKPKKCIKLDKGVRHEIQLLTANSKFLVLEKDNGEWLVMDAEKGKDVAELEEKVLSHLRMSNDNLVLLSKRQGSGRTNLILFDPENETREDLHIPVSPESAYTVSPDGKLYAYVKDGEIHVHQRSNDKEINTIHVFEGGESKNFTQLVKGSSTMAEQLQKLFNASANGFKNIYKEASKKPSEMIEGFTQYDATLTFPNTKKPLVLQSPEGKLSFVSFLQMGENDWGAANDKAENLANDIRALLPGDWTVEEINETAPAKKNIYIVKWGYDKITASEYPMVSISVHKNGTDKEDYQTMVVFEVISPSK